MGVRRSIGPAEADSGWQVGVALAGESQRLLLFGGAGASYPLYALLGRDPPPAPDADVLAVQSLLLRVGAAERGTVEGVGALSAHTAVVSGTRAVLFGGHVRNSASSAAFMYDLQAVSPTLGLQALPAAAAGPAARAYAGLVQRSGQSLLLFGGVAARGAFGSCAADGCCSGRAGVWDLWVLDLGSQAWATVPREAGGRAPQVVAFAAYSYLQMGDDSFALVLHGGLLCGYLQGATMSGGGCGAAAATGGPDCTNQAVGLVQLVGVQLVEDGLQYGTVKFGVITVGSVVPGARWMHAMLCGAFVAGGGQSALLYGGVGGDGVALDDVWLGHSEKIQTALCFTLRFLLPAGAGLPGGADALLDVLAARNDAAGCGAGARASMEAGCGGGSEAWARPADSGIGGGTTAWEVRLTATVGLIGGCVGRFYGAVGSFRLAAQRANSSWARADLDVAVPPAAGPLVEVRFDWVQFDPRSPAQGCQSACVGGFCSADDGSTPAACYGSGGCVNGTCALPGGRHGHTMVAWSFAGRTAPLVFGGETTSLLTAAPALSAELFAGYMQAGSLTWVRPPLGYRGTDGAEHACSAAVVESGNCPAPRRDAAGVLMDNSAGQNGRLLIFGGMTYCQPSAAVGRTCGSKMSPGLAYLSGSELDAPSALDDLWSLDLSRLGASCLRNGACPTSARLLWTLIPVAAGAGPPGRWGAAMAINPYTDTLYLTGGASVAAAADGGGGFGALAGLWSYALGDAYYASCAATGDGLEAAQAGQQASMLVSCKDVLGRAAASASVYVSVGGPVALSPAVSAVSGLPGTYRATYTAATAGDYALEIRVGRGGAARRQLIPGGAHALRVKAGVTSPAASQSGGDCLTLSTAGTVAGFSILARDALGNRRPGHDQVDVLFFLGGDIEEMPVAGQVNDMGDGSYQVQYSITRAGSYAVRVSLAGVVGAGTPAALQVQSGPTDVSRTYGYGAVRQCRAGASSSIFVQTRDAFGNFARVDPESYPDGLEDVRFELCHSVGDDPTRACAGGNREMGVSLTVSYGVAPPGADDGVAYGLYTLTYFPFSDGMYQRVVRHNGSLVVCLFDTPDHLDPGYTQADQCILQAQLDAAASVAAARRAARNVPALSSGPAIGARRAAMQVEEYMVVNATFREPDLQAALAWTTLAPLLAALAGLAWDLLCSVMLPARRALFRRSRRRARAAALEAEKKRSMVETGGGDVGGEDGGDGAGGPEDLGDGWGTISGGSVVLCSPPGSPAPAGESRSPREAPSLGRGGGLDTLAVSTPPTSPLLAARDAGEAELRATPVQAFVPDPFDALPADTPARPASTCSQTNAGSVSVSQTPLVGSPSQRPVSVGESAPVAASLASFTRLPSAARALSLGGGSGEEAAVGMVPPLVRMLDAAPPPSTVAASVESSPAEPGHAEDTAGNTQGGGSPNVWYWKRNGAPSSPP